VYFDGSRERQPKTSRKPGLAWEIKRSQNTFGSGDRAILYMRGLDLFGSECVTKSNHIS